MISTRKSPIHFFHRLGYRVSKYCGEHLVVVNESPVPEPTYHFQRSLSSTDNDINQNTADPDGPIAEALIQNDKMFHNLKILKPAPSDMQSEIQLPDAAVDQMTYRKPRKNVYSQVSIFMHLSRSTEGRQNSIRVQSTYLLSSMQSIAHRTLLFACIKSNLIIQGWLLIEIGANYSTIPFLLQNYSRF